MFRLGILHAMETARHISQNLPYMHSIFGRLNFLSYSSLNLKRAILTPADVSKLQLERWKTVKVLNGRRALRRLI